MMNLWHLRLGIVDEQAAKVEVPMVACQIRYYAGKSIDIVHLLHYIF